MKARAILFFCILSTCLQVFALDPTDLSSGISSLEKYLKSERKDWRSQQDMDASFQKFLTQKSTEKDLAEDNQDRRELGRAQQLMQQGDFTEALNRLKSLEKKLKAKSPKGKLKSSPQQSEPAESVR
jgi:hypothetical protein